MIQVANSLQKNSLSTAKKYTERRKNFAIELTKLFNKDKRNCKRMA